MKWSCGVKRWAVRLLCRSTEVKHTHTQTDCQCDETTMERTLNDQTTPHYRLLKSRYQRYLSSASWQWQSVSHVYSHCVSVHRVHSIHPSIHPDIQSRQEYSNYTHFSSHGCRLSAQCLSETELETCCRTALQYNTIQYNTIQWGYLVSPTEKQTGRHYNSHRMCIG